MPIFVTSCSSSTSDRTLLAGYTVRDADDNVVAEFAALVPEQNQTWEVGYRGAIGERLYFDVAGYHSRYQDFMSPLSVIANPFGDPATRAFDADGNEIFGETGVPQITLTYFNLGEATIYGSDAGATFALTPRFNLRGTLSLLRMSEVEGTDLPGGEEATALNSSNLNWTLGASGSEVGPFRLGTTVRHVQGYDFRSGINIGHIPTFTTLDASLGYRIAGTGAEVTLAANNLFTCRAAEEDGPSSCGFDNPHREMVNMPVIGTMLYLGLRYTP